MNEIEFLTKVEILEPLNLGFFVAVLFVLALTFLSCWFSRDATCADSVHICNSLILLYIVLFLSACFFSGANGTKTGRYKYTALPQEAITEKRLSEEYTNVEFKNGVWYFEDKEK